MIRQWPDSRIPQLFGIEHPVLQAPMAGAQDTDLALAVGKAGGLGALPCALLTPDKIRGEILRFRALGSYSFNLNFFCHQQLPYDVAKEKIWRAALHKYYIELGLDPDSSPPVPARNPFDEEACRMVEEFKPEVVSFHFGLPPKPWLTRVKATGAKVIASATSVTEARWLEDHGCDAIIAQGFEAGGHRGLFLNSNLQTQVGTMALIPQIVDAVRVPVIASGGIGDARGILAALSLGAAGVQMGTAFLLAAESRISPVHREALRSSRNKETVLTNLFTGRPARGLINRLIAEAGPWSDQAPDFPYAAGALAPLRAAAEAKGRDDFSPLWTGQAAHLAREQPAAVILKTMVDEVLQHLNRV